MSGLTRRSTTDDVMMLDDASGSALYAGQDTSRARVDFDRQRTRLSVFIRDMVIMAPSFDGEPARITRDAAQTAIRFLACLPSTCRLPRVAPDGEGDVIFVWGDGDFVVTIEPNALHLVANPGTPYTEHVDAIAFSAHHDHIPVSILQCLPRK